MEISSIPSQKKPRRRGKQVEEPTVRAFIMIGLKHQDDATLQEFEKYLHTSAEVVTFTMVSGQYDYMLDVRSTSLEKIHTFREACISNYPAVQTTCTLIALG
ncbi:hypothetical protein GCM10017044_04160 [Kordiimonas sediminis]|uniref:Transcription regulator AsnC/Lrp ligand binding domain-containing protein n=1 Tax=Kordiimonas sediminis TaxID=1735581 RepID=A0A919E4P1_9PROT|nr:Lrp/AsnC family transcriptional regulator [Kordiimonas sediminis]GHF13337.1 hypothetical protein GCM10017044_04160 [Kordiimonas sediminis]